MLLKHTGNLISNYLSVVLTHLPCYLLPLVKACLKTRQYYMPTVAVINESKASDRRYTTKVDYV